MNWGEPTVSVYVAGKGMLSKMACGFWTVVILGCQVRACWPVVMPCVLSYIIPIPPHWWPLTLIRTDTPPPLLCCDHGQANSTLPILGWWCKLITVLGWEIYKIILCLYHSVKWIWIYHYCWWLQEAKVTWYSSLTDISLTVEGALFLEASFLLRIRDRQRLVVLQIHKPSHNEWQQVAACSVALAHNGAHWARPSSHVLCAFIQECLEYRVYTATQMVAKYQPGLCSKTLVSSPFSFKPHEDSVCFCQNLFRFWTICFERHLKRCVWFIVEFLWLHIFLLKQFEFKNSHEFRMSRYLVSLSLIILHQKNLSLLYTLPHVVPKWHALLSTK